MIDFVENLFFILIETICCCLYFQTFSKFRFTKKIQILQFIGLTGCMTAVIYLFATIPFWKMPTVWFLFAVSMYGMFQMKFFEALGMGALYYALLLVVDVLAYACNDILQFRMGGETKVYGWKAWLIALLGKMFLFIIILLVRRIFGKSAVETLSKRMDKVSGISDIHHFYDRMDAGGRSEFTGGTWKNPYSVGIFTGRTQCFYLWIAL